MVEYSAGGLYREILGIILNVTVISAVNKAFFVLDCIETIVFVANQPVR